MADRRRTRRDGRPSSRLPRICIIVGITEGARKTGEEERRNVHIPLNKAFLGVTIQRFENTTLHQRRLAGFGGFVGRRSDEKLYETSKLQMLQLQQLQLVLSV